MCIIILKKLNFGIETQKMSLQSEIAQETYIDIYQFREYPIFIHKTRIAWKEVKEIKKKKTWKLEIQVKLSKNKIKFKKKNSYLPLVASS